MFREEGGEPYHIRLQTGVYWRKKFFSEKKTIITLIINRSIRFKLRLIFLYLSFFRLNCEGSFACSLYIYIDIYHYHHHLNINISQQGTLDYIAQKKISISVILPTFILFVTKIKKSIIYQSQKCASENFLRFFYFVGCKNQNPSVYICLMLMFNIEYIEYVGLMDYSALGQLKMKRRTKEEEI